MFVIFFLLFISKDRLIDYTKCTLDSIKNLVFRFHIPFITLNLHLHILWKLINESSKISNLWILKTFYLLKHTFGDVGFGGALTNAFLWIVGDAKEFRFVFLFPVLMFIPWFSSTHQTFLTKFEILMISGLPKHKNIFNTI